MNFLAGFWHDQHGHHPSLMRNNEIARKIVEHDRARRFNLMPIEKSLIGLCCRLWQEASIGNVEYILKHRLKTKRCGSQQRMFARTIGQNELAPRQGSDRIGEHWIRKKRGAIDIMREIEKIFRSDVMLFH
jgi:hypothetical protein